MERPCSSAHVLESSCCRPCVQDPAEGWGSAALWRVSREGDEAWGGVGPDTSLCGTLEFQPGDEGLLGQACSATLQLCGLGLGTPLCCASGCARVSGRPWEGEAAL